MEQVNTKKRKLNLNTCIEIELEEKKTLLSKKIRSCEEEINEMKDAINKINIAISKRCEEKNNGHIWIRERDEGPYGESYTFCKICRADYYDRSYLH